MTATSSDAAIVDFLGGATTATSYETAPVASNAGNTTSVYRFPVADDTNNNATDFPRRLTPTAEGWPAQVAPFTGTIAQIQGNGPIAYQGRLHRHDHRRRHRGIHHRRLQRLLHADRRLRRRGRPDPERLRRDLRLRRAANGLGSIPAVGHTANVVGLVTEFNGLTQIDTTVTAGSVADGGAATAIEPHTGALPGTDCALPGTACLSGTALAAVQEAHEGELWQPSGDMTVTDAYDGSAFGGDAWGTTASSSMFGEVGLAANSTDPLVAPTEVVDAQDHAAVDARTAYNKAHQLVLDDASSITYWNTSGHRP